MRRRKINKEGKKKSLRVPTKKNEDIKLSKSVNNTIILKNK